MTSELQRVSAKLFIPLPLAARNSNITTSERDERCFVHQIQLKIHILHKIIFSYPRFRSCIIIAKFIKYGCNAIQCIFCIDVRCL